MHIYTPIIPQPTKEYKFLEGSCYLVFFTILFPELKLSWRIVGGDGVCGLTDWLTVAHLSSFLLHMTTQMHLLLVAFLLIVHGVAIKDMYSRVRLHGFKSQLCLLTAESLWPNHLSFLCFTSSPVKLKQWQHLPPPVVVHACKVLITVSGT